MENTTRDEMIFGIRSVIEAIQSGKEFDRLFIQAGLQGGLISELKRVAKEFNTPYQQVPSEKLNRLTRKTHQGVVGFLSQIGYYSIGDMLPLIFEKGKTPLLVMLDRITDVRNFGAIARSAYAAGADFIIIPTRGGAPINADAIKTSAGALIKLPVCREVNLKEAIHYLKTSGVMIVAANERSQTSYTEINLTGPVCILLGNEEEGVSHEYLKMTDAEISIPMIGEIGSLNVSVANGILLYEVVRQRLAGK
jgi:23S rRNA (guanosine2251-2'-O)-methyltransferase